MRSVYLLLACLFLAVAIVGIIFPLIPGVPFLLLAAWFSARGSRRLHAWIYKQPYLGKLLDDWQKHKAISRKTKIIALLMLAVSWVILYQYANIWVLVTVSVIFVVVSIYIMTRPHPD